MSADSVDKDSSNPESHQSLQSSDSSSNDDHTSSQTDNQNRLSGKKLVLGFVFLMVVCGGALVYTLWSYEQLEHARQRTADDWRRVADGLNARYQSLENSFIGSLFAE